MLIDELSQPRDKPVMTLSAYSIQGKRTHMEDYFDIGYQMKPCDQQRPNEWPYEYFYFGIFDGHGGSEAANFAKQNLLKFITQQTDFWSTVDEDVMSAIRKGFADTHLAMRAKMSCWTRTGKILPSTAGTTASVLFIRNGKFYTGHVGDSRIAISTENPETHQWISKRLTTDHKPESKDETDRIQRAGGEVKSKIGVHRVVWKRPVLVEHIKHTSEDLPTYPINENIVESYQTIPFLAIARSLGDFWSLNPHTGQYVVSPEPDVSCRPISPNDKCILLATDGLWNVMNTSKAVRLLQELSILKDGKRQYCENDYFISDNFYDVAGSDVDNHAQSLVYFAYQIWERRRLRSDNITVVVAMLHDLLDHFHRSNKTYITRANTQSEKQLSKYEPKTSGPNQIGETYNFHEEIRLNKEPKFCLPEPNVHMKWQQLEHFLVLPPTILETEEREYKDGFDHPKLVFPRNYMRLSIAACRKISRQESYPDSFIYIKHVSDDPADEQEMPTRLGKSGKEVKDASAQATQSIHDFGMPWDQLLDEDNEECDDKLFLSEVSMTDVDGDIEDDKNVRSSDEDHDDDVEEEDEEEDGHEGEDEEESDTGDVMKKLLTISNSAAKAPKKEEKSIPQLRCLLNYTPPLRRSPRSTYLSVSDNAKRKVNPPPSVVLPKSKRRKSQPNRFNLARA